MISVSVVIPMYNSKYTIGKALDSVLNQTYQGVIEIIIINDGSIDGSEKVVEEAILNNETNRTINLINKLNGGVSSARNIGIQKSTAEWIGLLDSDDIWLPEKLEKQVAIIEKNTSINFIGTNRNNELYPFFRKKKQYIYALNAKEIILKWYPQTSTVLIRKDTLLKSDLYDESKTHAEDGDLWLKIAQYSKLYVLNEDLVYTGGGKRGFGESGLSANMPKMYKGEILALKGAKERMQINALEYIGFYFWLTLRYCRRILIIKASE